MAATSTGEVREKIKPYIETGATRVILPYVPSSASFGLESPVNYDDYLKGIEIARKAIR